MLGDDFFSEEVLKLYFKILSDVKLLRSRGTYCFISHIYNDFQLLNKSQLNNLKKVIVKNSEFFIDNTLRLVTLDLFLRKMSPQDIFDMQKLATDLNLSDDKNDIIYGINEMASRYSN